ncbi:MAG: hypothetical protein ACXWJW_12575 [Xanthobacteraceae bacterium]
MSPSNTFLLLGVVAWVACELLKTLLTGRAHASQGLVTVKTLPEGYWRFVYSRCAVLAISGSFLMWTLTAYYVA